jgi:anti-sigma B factor antagonist
VRIAVKIKDDVAVMELEGKFLAGSDGPFLRQKAQELMDAGFRKLLIDLTEVPYIDSTGLGFLAGSRSVAEKNGTSMVLCGVNTHVMRILDGVQLSPFFTIAADEAAAMQILHARAKNDKAAKGRKKTQGPAGSSGETVI